MQEENAAKPVPAKKPKSKFSFTGTQLLTLSHVTGMSEEQISNALDENPTSVPILLNSFTPQSDEDSQFAIYLPLQYAIC